MVVTIAMSRRREARGNKLLTWVYASVACVTLAVLGQFLLSSHAVSSDEVPTSPNVTNRESALLQEAEKLFTNKCSTCHALKKGAASLVGPNLAGVFGRSAGSVEDFPYSRPMRDSGVVWSRKSLDAFIERPAAVIPGNRMAFGGVKKPDQRKMLVDFLESSTHSN